jgi:hypothetical protein
MFAFLWIRSSAAPVGSHPNIKLDAIDASKVDRTLAFDESHHPRDRIFGRNADHHEHMIRHQMTFPNLALLLHRQFAKNLPEMSPRLSGDQA